MSIDEQEIRAIAFLVARCRPVNSKPWDEPGIVANLRKVAHLNLAEVAMATIRAAANRQADSPGVIPNMTGEHWREKVAERTAYRPPRREESCHCCGKHLDQDVHRDCPPRAPKADPAEYVSRARAALRSPE